MGQKIRNYFLETLAASAPTVTESAAALPTTLLEKHLADSAERLQHWGKTFLENKIGANREKFWFPEVGGALGVIISPARSDCPPPRALISH